jgi:hypothetical protein
MKKLAKEKKITALLWRKEDNAEAGERKERNGSALEKGNEEAGERKERNCSDVTKKGRKNSLTKKET